ncbi:hypothetical protein AVEN_118678-1 [Araneus ventricosus]|uniref:Uncharacterized protein n=1 Tax=Araneus ventricosus TaxID=182803 RepID=A0A4Y2AXP7_ARAVE|nr:hypothetical protein AVEN_118678-1 [Araneus ventricosus]
MMVKFGNIMISEYHLCYAHAVHLAMCDVLYKKREDLGERTFEIENISYEEEGEDIDESGDLIEVLDKALDLEFEGGIATNDMFHIDCAENNR